MLRKPLWNTGVQIIGKAAMVLISLMITGLMTRRLEVGVYGDFVLISALFVFLDSLADFGSKTIGIRESVKNKENKETWQELFQFRWITAAMAFGVGIGLVAILPSFKGIKLEAMMAMLMIFLTSLGGMGEMVWQVKMRMEKKVIFDVVFPILFLLFIVFVSRLNLLTVIGGYLLARMISVGLIWFSVDELKSINWREKINFGVMKQWLRMTLPMGIFLLIFASYDRVVDSMIIRSYLGAAEVAWYGLAYKIYGVLIQPAYFFVNSIFPLLSSDIQSKRSLFWRSLAILMAGGIVVVLGVLVSAPLMINVLGGVNYLPAVSVLRVLILGCLFSYIGHLLGFVLISRGRQDNMVTIGIMALVFNLVMNWLMIPRFGILAAAWVTVFTEVLHMLTMGFFLKKSLN